MSLIFSCRDLCKSYGDHTLFSDLSIDLKAGEQLGLIGMNGSGKSTFLKMTAGLSAPDSGQVTRTQGYTFYYLEQADQLDPELSVEQTLYEAARSAFDDKQRHAIVQSLLGKGGFEDPDQKITALSGGWRKRLSITRALCAKPEVLLLDEPTNHLDIGGIIWLEEILKAADFTFIVVSHDRAFLENICTHTMEIARYYPSGYFRIKDTYTEFKKQRDRLLSAQAKKQASLSSKMRREDQWLKQGAKARSTKAKYRIEEAERLRQELADIKFMNKETSTVNIDFDGTGRQTKKLLRAQHIEKTVEQTTLFSHLSFELGPGSCLGVVGENGSGKSTFLSVLEKKSPPDAGKIIWAENLKIAVFDQNRSSLDPSATLRQALNPAGGDSVNFRGQPVHIVTWAKRFLFMPDQLDMPVKSLSGGEQAKIILANIMLTPCDLLLLDEPTNDLDIPSLEVLEESIRQFQGAVVIVSHDRYLMDRVCEKILYLSRRKPAQFYKNFTQILASDKAPAKKKPAQKKAAPAPVKSRKFSYKDKYELEHIEENILEAESEVESFSEKIQEPEILKDAEQMKHFCSLLKQAQDRVHHLYERWEILETKKAESES